MNPGRTSPCVFHDPCDGGSVLVHGDDFVGVTSRHHAMRIVEHLESKWEVKTTILGPAENDAKSVRILNRMITWGSNELHYEADKKHAEIMVKKHVVAKDRDVTTPGENVNVEEGAEELTDVTEVRDFRADAARMNYLSMDRPDLQFSAKEASKHMAKPRECDKGKVKRMAKYLRSPGRARMVQAFRFERLEPVLLVSTDSDWAGCKSTRKSTSGGVVATNIGVLKHWSSNQKHTALSAPEAELYAINRGAAEARGTRCLGHDLGIHFEVVIQTDSSSAIGITSRRGLGKLRHVGAQELKVQDAVRAGEIELAKVPGDDNVADILTKNVDADTLQRHMAAMGFKAVTK